MGKNKSSPFKVFEPTTSRKQTRAKILIVFLQVVWLSPTAQSSSAASRTTSWPATPSSSFPAPTLSTTSTRETSTKTGSSTASGSWSPGRGPGTRASGPTGGRTDSESGFFHRRVRWRCSKDSTKTDFRPGGEPWPSSLETSLSATSAGIRSWATESRWTLPERWHNMDTSTAIRWTSGH